MTEITMNYVKPKGLGARHVQTLLLFLGMFLAFTMRVNMSMAIVAMTSHSNATYFDWSLSVQSLVLSSFFWGYVILQIPGGEMASRVGGKVLLTISIGVNSMISLILPFAASLGGWKLVCGCRFLQGLTQAFVYPSTHHLVSQWIPLDEKGLLTTIVYAGGQLGVASQLIIAGFQANTWGWQTIFYTNGIFGLLWTITYIIFGSVSPEQSKIISEEEVLYIQKSLGRIGEQKRYPTPWFKIIRSLPFWAVIVAHCGQNWGFFTLMTEMPTYMRSVIGVNLKTNGLLSCLPYFSMFILSFPMGAMTDLIIRKKWLSVSNTRKLFNSIGLWGPGIFLIALCYVPRGNLVLAVVMLTLSVGINAGQFSGYMLVHIDLAPNFSASLMGITNFLANIISIIAPIYSGFIVYDEEDPTEWRKVFFMASAVYFFTNLFFVVFGTSLRQSWNEPENLTRNETVGFGYRHVQTLLLFFVTFLGFTMRVNLSLAIVAMTNKANKIHYDWNIKTRSIVLSSFFWGYVLMMIPSGILAKKFGGKILVAYAILINAIISTLIPLSADIGGWPLVCGCRIVQGLTQSPIFPALQQLICQWIPLEEKGLLATMIFAGSQLGIAVQLSVSGFIATAWGWPAIFYTNGTTGIIWFIIYIIFGSVSPERCRFVSECEATYIQTSIGRVGAQKQYPIPWKEIFKCIPFYAAVVAHCGYNMGFFTMMTEMPTYMDKVLNVNLSKNGLFSAMPYVASYTLSFVMGALTDLIKKRKWLSVTNSRKLFNTIAFWGPAVTFIGLGYVPKNNVNLALCILIITIGFNSAHYVGHMLVHSDMTPNFSSVLFGISSFVSGIMSILAPIVCGFIIQDEKDPKEWRKVFIVASFIYFFTNLIFLIFASGKRQAWNEPKLK